VIVVIFENIFHKVL